jgi:hypothetical protein
MWATIPHGDHDEAFLCALQDSGIDPKIEEGLRGINVTCDKWSIPAGLHVGSSMQDVNSHIGAYCPSTRTTGTTIIATKEGIWYEAKHRKQSCHAYSCNACNG